LTEWEAASRAHNQPTTPKPTDIVAQRLRALCPSFTLESVSGEELYWLSKLCEQSREKALPAVERYLAGSNLEHASDARLLLAMLQMRTTGGWEAAWGTLQTIMQEDPIEQVYGQISIAIDDEADITDSEKALEWSKTRYALLLNRNQTEKPHVSPVPSAYVLSAGSDLVHRYYLAGETALAVRVLDEVNSFEKSHPDEGTGWGASDLRWANLEMHPAPSVTVLKMFGSGSSSGLIQPGRVEVISFFFLGCSPCNAGLDALQKRYGKKQLLVTDVTTYDLNSYLTPSSHSNPSAHSDIEASLEKARLENTPRINVVITSDETLASYGANHLPVVAIVDKKGRIRYVGSNLEFEDDDSAGQLIRKLIEE
jgi:cytochrome oxidase Cu insertion factor (SCO1/SenC/PrrC family)